ncbi:hypothetical protein QL285_026877 [Trifolium repens]|nr:hypothetical protein QL285_026877 [Trifolium repens]
MERGTTLTNTNLGSAIRKSTFSRCPKQLGAAQVWCAIESSISSEKRGFVACQPKSKLKLYYSRMQGFKTNEFMN